LTQNATLAIINLHKKELPDASELGKRGKILELSGGVQNWQKKI